MCAVKICGLGGSTQGAAEAVSRRNDDANQPRSTEEASLFDPKLLVVTEEAL